MNAMIVKVFSAATFSFMLLCEIGTVPKIEAAAPPAKRLPNISVVDWLMGEGLPTSLSQTKKLVQLVGRKHIQNVMNGQIVSIALPTNNAWNSSPTTKSWYSKLMSPGGATARQDVVLAASAGTDKVGDYNALYEYSLTNGGAIYTTYGTPMVVQKGRYEICAAKYVGGKPTARADQCIGLMQPPLLLKDASIYLTDKIVLPPELIKDIEKVVG